MHNARRQEEGIGPHGRLLTRATQRQLHHAVLADMDVGYSFGSQGFLSASFLPSELRCASFVLALSPEATSFTSLRSAIERRLE